jgi:hypothetical protein
MYLSSSPSLSHFLQRSRFSKPQLMHMPVDQTRNKIGNSWGLKTGRHGCRTQTQSVNPYHGSVQPLLHVQRRQRRGWLAVLCKAYRNNVTISSCVSQFVITIDINHINALNNTCMLCVDRIVLREACAVHERQQPLNQTRNNHHYRTINARIHDCTRAKKHRHESIC